MQVVKRIGLALLLSVASAITAGAADWPAYLRILDAIKKILGPRVTTVFVRQGHYAHEAKHLDGYMPADVTLERIGELVEYDAKMLLDAVG